MPNKPKSFLCDHSRSPRQAAGHGASARGHHAKRSACPLYSSRVCSSRGGRSHPSGARSYRLAGGFALHLSISGAHTAAPARMGGRGNSRRPFAPEATTSAGVVLAHALYPASQLMDLAGNSPEFAKRKATDLAKKKHIDASLDFMGLHPPVVKGSTKRRQHLYTV